MNRDLVTREAPLFPTFSRLLIPKRFRRGRIEEHPCAPLLMPQQFEDLSLQFVGRDKHPRKKNSIVVSLRTKGRQHPDVEGTHCLIVEHPTDGAAHIEAAYEALSVSCSTGETPPERLVNLSSTLRGLTRKGHGLAGWNHYPLAERLDRPVPVIAHYPNDPLNPQAWNTLKVFHIPLPFPGKDRGKWNKLEKKDELAARPEEKHLVWISSVGECCADADKTLDALSQKFFNFPLTALVAKDIHGAPKAKFHNDVFTASISVLRSEVGDPLSVIDYPIHAVLKGNSLMTLDESGSALFASVQNELETEAASSRLRGVGAVTGHLLERILDNNSQVVDTVERGIAELREQVALRKIGGRKLLDRLDEAEKTLSYVKRKSNQTKDTISSLMEAGENDHEIFAGHDPDRMRINLQSKIGTLISRVDDQIRTLEKIGLEYETDQTSLRDQTIEKFTILVGLSAPPIIADFLFGKENHTAMYISFGIGVLLAFHNWYVQHKAVKRSGMVHA